MVFFVGQTGENVITNGVTFTPPPPPPPPGIFTASVTPTNVKTGFLTHFTLVYYKDGVIYTDSLSNMDAHNTLSSTQPADFRDDRHF